MIILICCLWHFREEIIFVQQDSAQLLLTDMRFGMGDGFHMEVHPNPIVKLHQPSIHILFVAGAIRVLVGALHIEDSAEFTDPMLLPDKICCLGNNKNNVVILEYVFRHILICPGAV